MHGGSGEADGGHRQSGRGREEDLTRVGGRRQRRQRRGRRCRLVVGGP